MKFQLALITLLPLIYSLPTAEPASEAEISDASPAALFKRACDYKNNDCTSAPGAKAGKYCGFCKQVENGFPGSHPTYIFQVNGKTTKDNCCSYGPSKSCAAKWPSLNGEIFYNCKNTDKGY